MRVRYQGYPLRVRSRMYVRKLERTQQSHPPIPLSIFNKNDRINNREDETIEIMKMIPSAYRALCVYECMHLSKRSRSNHTHLPDKMVPLCGVILNSFLACMPSCGMCKSYVIEIADVFVI